MLHEACVPVQDEIWCCVYEYIDCKCGYKMCTHPIDETVALTIVTWGYVIKRSCEHVHNANAHTDCGMRLLLLLLLPPLAGAASLCSPNTSNTLDSDAAVSTMPNNYTYINQASSRTGKTCIRTPTHTHTHKPRHSHTHTPHPHSHPHPYKALTSGGRCAK